MPVGVYPHKPLIERFWQKVGKTEDCWEWRGTKLLSGYCVILLNGKQLLAHRVAYEAFVGKIPIGLQIDHLCRNRACVNPAHMETVTRHENIKRGMAGRLTGLSQRIKTHCRYGHPYNEENTYHRPDNGRDCKICQHRRAQESWRRK